LVVPRGYTLEISLIKDANGISATIEEIAKDSNQGDKESGMHAAKNTRSRI
jgi:hypothetical protein